MKDERVVNDDQDAYGHGIYDCFIGKGSFELVECEYGHLCVSNGPGEYLSGYEDWPLHQQKAMHYVKGRVLDIGCGAGRHALYLQEKGFDVLGIDMSPLAVEVCKLRGLKKVKVMSITGVGSESEGFGTILMLGNNFGLFGSFERAKLLLKKFHRITENNARIITESTDPYNSTDPSYLQYLGSNKKRGRMPGQLKVRVKYGSYVTPWFDYLFVSKAEMKEIVKSTGWEIKEFIDSEDPEDSVYVAVIEKESENESEKESGFISRLAGMRKRNDCQ
ncbi:class I SAM-dependent methyltransferase [Methanosarcina sp. T3]|uniref:class I SAM-dependent methyltransferase n=1 Tax=Methanosarcina sp. T3 TaxID=3439062 RepID=UPI003F87A91D